MQYKLDKTFNKAQKFYQVSAKKSESFLRFEGGGVRPCAKHTAQEVQKIHLSNDTVKKMCHP